MDKEHAPHPDDYYIKSICPSGGHGRGHRMFASRYKPGRGSKRTVITVNSSTVEVEVRTDASNQSPHTAVREGAVSSIAGLVSSIAPHGVRAGRHSRCFWAAYCTRMTSGRHLCALRSSGSATLGMQIHRSNRTCKVSTHTATPKTAARAALAPVLRRESRRPPQNWTLCRRSRRSSLRRRTGKLRSRT